MGMSYVGVDPNARLLPAADALVEAYAAHGTPHIELYPCGFETWDACGRTFDFAIASPPFKKGGERYSPDPTQASERDDWQCWYRTYIKKLWSCIKPGGFMAIHVSDTRHMPAHAMTLEIMGVPKFTIGVQGRGGHVWSVPVWQK
jgi:hypothetical protein